MIAAADEETLTALSNKGIYKRACKDTEGITNVDYTENEDLTGSCFADVKVGSEMCSITAPLSESRCSCPSRGICRHIISALLLLKKEVPEGTEPVGKIPEKTVSIKASEEQSDTEKSPARSSKKDKITVQSRNKLKECAENCSGLLSGLLLRGLVRADPSVCEDIELAATSCHAVKAADAEKLLRELGSRLSECTSRSAAFDVNVFTKLLTRCFAEFDKLSGDTVTPEMLGSFRRTYEPYNGALDMIPIGERSLSGGEHEGEIYYFLNMDKNAKQRFLSVSDLRPVYYERFNERRAPAVTVWGAGVPINRLMRSRLTLSGAKVSCGSISTSNETEIIVQTSFNMNCSEVFSLIVTDLREIAVTVSERGGSELERMFFFKPEKLEEYTFDKYEQRSDIWLSDRFGNTARASVKYRSETKELIGQIEQTCASMQKKPGEYTLLVTANIENGELVLFPIEFYGFLHPYGLHSYSLPERYSDCEREAGYAYELFGLFDEVESRVSNIVRSGLQSDGGDHSELIKRVRNTGASYLAEIAEKLFTHAGNFRHRTDGDPAELLPEISAVIEYISIGRKKAGLICALANMKGE